MNLGEKNLTTNHIAFLVIPHVKSIGCSDTEPILPETYSRVWHYEEFEKNDTVDESTSNNSEVITSSRNEVNEEINKSNEDIVIDRWCKRNWSFKLPLNWIFLILMICVYIYADPYFEP